MSDRIHWRRWLLLAVALLALLALAGCGPRTQAQQMVDDHLPTPPSAQQGEAEDAPSVADLEAALRRVEARRASLEAELVHARAAEERARVDAWQARLWWVAGLGSLLAIAGAVLLFTGLVARRWAGVMVVGGVALTACALVFSWLIPWLVYVAPVAGLLFLVALGLFAWNHRRVTKEAVRFGNDLADHLKRADPDAWARLRDLGIWRQNDAGVAKHIERIVEAEKPPKETPNG